MAVKPFEPYGNLAIRPAPTSIRESDTGAITCVICGTHGPAVVGVRGESSRLVYKCRRCAVLFGDPRTIAPEIAVKPEWLDGSSEPPSSRAERALKRRRTDAEHDAVMRLWRAGGSRRTIVARTGLPPSTVAHWLREASEAEGA